MNSEAPQLASALRSRDALVNAKRAAVIDIGSNSVRLVVYALFGRVFLPGLNEKVLAGLGRGLSETGQLNPEGRTAALRALKRYRAIVDGLGLDAVYPVATAAMRDATDGPEFLDDILRQTGFEVRVLTGVEEARMAAYGVISGAALTEGVVGDLGGSSLELVRFKANLPSAGETFPLGPLALDRGDGFRAKAITHRAETVLSGVEALQGENDAFFAIGGAWRAMMRIHMRLADYPLQVLQGFEVSADDARSLVKTLIDPSKAERDLIQSVAGRRAETIPYAACVFGAVLDAGQFNRVRLSSFGLREGVLYDTLGEGERAQDTLIAGLKALALPDTQDEAFANKLRAWIGDVLVVDDHPDFRLISAERTTYAACLLANIGVRLHPDHRADLCFDLVVRGPYAGVGHRGRVALALAIGHRYARKFRLRPITERILTAQERRWAAALGAAVRLGCEISGQASALLQKTAIYREGETLVLAVESAALVSQSVETRLEALANVLGLKAEIHTPP